MLHAVGAAVVVSALRAERLEALVAELPGAIAIAADMAAGHSLLVDGGFTAR